MPTLRQQRYDYLIKSGFLPREATEYASNYSMNQIRTVPYLQNIVRSRRLYVNNLRSRDYSDSDIRNAILRLYRRRNMIQDNAIDPWEALRRARQKAIEEGDYIPPKRKGSHHPIGVSKGQLADQRKRRNVRIQTNARKDLQSQIESLNDQIGRASIRGDQAERRRLEAQRNRLQLRLDRMRE